MTRQPAEKVARTPSRSSGLKPTNETVVKGAPGAKAVFWIPAAITILTLFAFFGVWENDFINFDDPPYVLENQHVNQGMTWEGLLWSFRESAMGNWHPLTWLSHALDCELFGVNPAGHHTTSLLMHLANSLLLYFAMRSLTGSNWRSGTVAALFAVHPLHVESVAWVAERKDVLSGFFFMLTLMAYANYARADWKLVNIHSESIASLEGCKSRRRATLWYGLTLLFFALGLMSKPMLVTLPFVLLLLDYWPLNRASAPGAGIFAGALRMTGDRRVSGSDKRKTAHETGGDAARAASPWQRLVLEKWPFFLLTIASSIVTLLTQRQAMMNTTTLPFMDRFGHAALAYVAYLHQMFWPTHLSVFYPHPVELATIQILGAAMVLLAITLLALYGARRRPETTVGWFWFLGMLVPVIGIVQVGLQARADRYTYLPSIGVFVAVTWVVAALAAAHKKLRPFLVIAAGVSILSLALVTHRQVEHWRTNETLFSHAAEVTSNNYVALGGLAIASIRRGEVPKAVEYLDRALEAARIYKAENTVKYYMGVALQLQGKGLEALPYLEEAQLDANLAPDGNYRLGLSLMEAGRVAEAERALAEALRAKPQNLEFQLAWATLLATKGQNAQAEQSFRDIIARHSDSGQAHRTYADYLLLQGRPAEAAANYATALRLKTSDAPMHRSYAAALTRVGNSREAIEQLEAALKLQPNDPATNFELAELLSQQGLSARAVTHYEKALEADPNSIGTLNNLAWILATDSNAEVRSGPRAVELAERACRLSEWKMAVLIGTLGAAYAESGRFTEAIAMAEKARDLARAGNLNDVVKSNEALLELYRAGKPARAKE